MPVPKSDAGKEIEQLVIWGVENRKEDADKKLVMLSSYLESGGLPNIEILERRNVEPAKKNLLDLTVYFIIGVVVLSLVYGFIRHKNVKIVGVIFGIFATDVLLFLGIISSEVFAFIFIISCAVLVFMKGDGHGWVKLVTIALMFLISFGAVANRLVVDSYTLFGVIVGFTLGLGQFILSNEILDKSSRKQKKTIHSIWKIIFILVVVLTSLFFLQSYKNIAIASTIILMSSLALTKPEYTRLVKKLKRS